MISWSVIEYGKQMATSGELGHAMDAVKWGYRLAHESSPSIPCSLWIAHQLKLQLWIIKRNESRNMELPDAVSWNSWDKKEKAMVDSRDDEYKHVVFVETATVQKTN
ncbi:hypothetical protein L1987_80379 [Smallanthus sonchifolius]|uniref:Uncharacterized protein n=1 Tax=Smallanthus sonchifolius TaxID=185202 RepID=A0ACB8YRR7_9ASTR|nr:hypothetical protein L1987_80379 [Smallanthus sonchifolius]